MTATTQMTQTGEDDMPEYISIYEKPKYTKRGRPRNTIQLTDEEKKERMRKLASRHYYENTELRKFQQAQNYQRVKKEKAQNTLKL